MTESHFKSSLTHILVREEIPHVVSSFSIVRGIPDMLMLYFGTTVGAELKIKGNKPTALQLHELEKIVKHKGKGWLLTLDGDEVVCEEMVFGDTCPATTHFILRFKIALSELKRSFPQILTE